MCGLAIAAPYIGLAKSFIALPIAAFHELVASAQVCLTKPNCGAPNLSSEQKSEIDQGRQAYADRMAKIETDTEALLCQSDEFELGCPFPKFTCAKWEKILGGEKAELDGREISLNDLRQKTAVAKTNFCRHALEIASKLEVSDRATQVEVAEEAIRLWFADYGKRWQCYQPQYIAEELCKLVGEGSSFAFGGPMVTKALSLAAKGLSAAQIAKAFKAIPTLGNLLKGAAAETTELDKLRLLLSENRSSFKHELLTDSKTGENTLKIAMLQRRDGDISKAMLGAVKEGSIQKIDAGLIVGPKVLNLLAKLKDIAPKDHPLIVTGSISPTKFSEKMEKYKRVTVLDAGKKSTQVPDFFTEKDISDYSAAIETLGIDKACAQLGRTASNCGELRFTFDARYPQNVVWK